MKVVCKVVCVDTHEGGRPNKDLTLGKIYETYITSDTKHLVINDCGHHKYYQRRMFKTFQEIRNDKLNEIGI